MSWNDNRVRVELGEVMTVAFGSDVGGRYGADMKRKYSAEIWPLDSSGKVEAGAWCDGREGGSVV